jgi:hypothetical protein
MEAGGGQNKTVGHWQFEVEGKFGCRQCQVGVYIHHSALLHGCHANPGYLLAPLLKTAFENFIEGDDGDDQVYLIGNRPGEIIGVGSIGKIFRNCSLSAGKLPIGAG